MLETAAQTLKLQLYAAGGCAAKDLEAAFAAMGQGRPAAFAAVGSSMLLASRGRIVELAAKQELPGVFPQREFVDAGGLFAYRASLTDGLRRAATVNLFSGFQG
jgi:putative ABC transport system substrate-binding protein